MTLSRRTQKQLQKELSEYSSYQVSPQEQQNLLTLKNVEQFFELSVDLLCIVGLDGYFKWLNSAFPKTLGYCITELVEQPFLNFVHPEDRLATSQAIEKLTSGIPVFKFENRYCCKNGSYKWLEWTTSSLTEEGLVYYAVARDISERKFLEEALFQVEQQAQITFKFIGDGAIITDAQGKIKYLNPIAEKLTGWSLKEAKEKPFAQIFQLIDEYTRQSIACPVEEVLQKDKIVNVLRQSILLARDGTESAIDELAAPIHSLGGKIVGSVVIFHDRTESDRLTVKLAWQSKHDVLTGLYNRHEFEQQVIEAIASTKSNRQQHVLCFLDLDQFKVVNDICGHLAGDKLLRQITFLLQQQVRSQDLLARLGSDEFGLLLKQTLLSEAEKIANTLREIIEAFRFSWEGKTFNLGVSIGLVPIDANSHDYGSVLGAANAACYMAKEKGRNCLHIYRSDDSEIIKQRDERQWIYRLNQALTENRFSLYCQRIAPLKNSFGTDHYEILLRLFDEENNLVPPMAFIPAAERYNLMPAIDRWVIATFFACYVKHCHQNRHNFSEIPLKCDPDAVYTINLSGTSINDEQFLSFVKEQFAKYPISPKVICFEITETTAIANLNKAAELIIQLKELGCSFALDDFGSGMSSLAYLKNLPVDYLKIDGSFVKNIVNNAVDRVTVECFSRIGHVMNIQTIAEFVENEAIIDELREIGVDYGQGYGISKPCPLTF
jgi:diguanylate cyclase (GGDEF)-like protein/PAS domain S-box-containing protein